MNIRRKFHLPLVLSSLAFAMTLALPATAAENDPTAVAPPSVNISFKPPLRGAPKMRVGGGVRGADTQEVALDVLAPESAGLTTAASPTIYWFLSDTVQESVEIAITDTRSIQDAAKPVLDIQIPGPVQPGVHAVDLSKHGVTLIPGVEYQWFVAVVVDPAQRSKDVLAGGAIIRTEDAALGAGAADATALAEAGIWYDAVDDLSRRIESNPGDGESRALRAALLEQVGLEDGAAYDRAQLGG